MTDLTPEKLAELRRDAESWLMIGGERVLPLLNALDAARAERDALTAKLAVVLALLAERAAHHDRARQAAIDALGEDI